MPHIWTSPWFWVAVLASAVLLWPESGILARLHSRWALHRRWLVEDALKHILAWEQRAQNATPESLAGALGIAHRHVVRLITRMEAKGLVQSAAGGLRLTPEGERWALHVVRAHRLWERYLADDAGMPLSRLHQAAEKAEHHLSAERLDALEAHLGYPQRDPHGDPIPTSDGALAPVNAVALCDWPAGPPARIAHIEDEPDVIFKQILAAGLKPGVIVRVLESSPQRLVISDGENEHHLAPAVAANIQVTGIEASPERPTGAKRLSDLRPQESAEVIEIDEQARGFSRRRLLDLGLTPSARVEAALENPFGDPRGYRVRGTLIALRRQQADHVWVRSTNENSAEAERLEATKV